MLSTQMITAQGLFGSACIWLGILSVDYQHWQSVAAVAVICAIMGTIVLNMGERHDIH